jgi:hypothetical protein
MKRFNLSFHRHPRAGGDPERFAQNSSIRPNPLDSRLRGNDELRVLLLLAILLFPLAAHADPAGDVTAFCANANRTMPADGKQFDGKPADETVLDLRNGTYALANDGSVQIFESGAFILTKPKNIVTFFGPGRYSSAQVLEGNGTISGCSLELLSELMKRNNIAPPTGEPQK